MEANLPTLSHLNPNVYLNAVKHCCKGFDLPFDKGLSQQPRAMRKKELFLLCFDRSFKQLQEAIKISYT